MGEKLDTYRLYVIHHLDYSHDAVATNRTFTGRTDDEALNKAKRFIETGGFTYQSFHLVREEE